MGFRFFQRRKALKPIYDRQSYSDAISSVIEYELYNLIYKPLFEILEPKILARSAAKISAIKKALEINRISYQDGYFKGNFSAEISRELRSLGAVFDKTRKAFCIDVVKVPIEVKQSISQGKILAEEKRKDMISALDKVKNIPTISFEGTLDRVIGDLNKQFKATVKTVVPDIAVQVEISDEMAEQIKQEYMDNMDIYIQDWREEAVKRLRKQIEYGAQEGFRAEKMVDVLKAEYGITQGKAKFLARQETSLFVSKFRQARYQEAGIDEYRWSTSGDERVRKDHRDLNNKAFRWDAPPIVDRATGRRGHPGEDFGCRCVAIPLLKETR